MSRRRSRTHARPFSACRRLLSACRRLFSARRRLLSARRRLGVVRSTIGFLAALLLAAAGLGGPERSLAAEAGSRSGPQAGQGDGPLHPADRAPWREIEQVPIDSMSLCRTFAGVDHPNVDRLCERIVATWEAAAERAEPCPDADACPGAHARHLGYLLVDFGGEETPRAERVLPVRALVALLAAPRLLPPRMTGGLLIRGAVFERPLVFKSVRVATPITLSESYVRGGRVHRPYTGRATQGTDPSWQLGPGGMALVVEDSVFEGPLTIGSGTWLGGRVLMANSSFSQLIFRRAALAGELELWRIRSEVLGLYRTEFSSGLYAVDNLLGAVQTNGSDFRGDMIVNSNRIDGRFWLGRTSFLGDAGSITITDNGVRGPFTFIRNEAGPGLRQLDLSYNRLDASAEVRVPKLATEETAGGDADPAHWSGRVRMTGLVAQGELRIQGLGEPAEGEAACGAAGAQLQADDRSVMFDLTAAEVRVLSWLQPEGCYLRWQGRGFRYDLFDPNPGSRFDHGADLGGNAAGNSDIRLSALDSWRDAFRGADGDRVDALTHLASYLQSQGYRAKARDVLEDAKGADYTNWAKDDWLRWPVAQALALGGYGAKPERAAGLLLLLWVMGALVYGGYSRFHRWRYGWENLSARDAAKYGTRRKREVPRGFWYIGYGKSDESTYPGFLLIDKELYPHRMTSFQYSLDAIIPIISLHAYDRFYPASNPVRLFALLQHVVGIALWGVFIATAAIL